ncbi:hypothetical protein BS78_07G003000 [Paspalum vaginatum]|nr:hypothetical protein BS78_07G003000 [Paspalum vaginatum]
MGSCSRLSDSLDFSHGISFADDIRRRFGTSVHHPSSSPAGSFLLLVTFRRFLFRLTEESHVGFAVYKLKRFVGPSFDAYFHLWNDGVAHWEHEKLLWEHEQEAEWTKVLSKQEKRRTSAIPKRVRFADQLV